MDVINDKLFSSGPVVLFQWEAASNCPILSVSPNIQQVLGYSVIELTSRNKCYTDLIHPDDRTSVYEQINRNLAQNINKTGRLVYRLEKKDGSYIWVEDHTVVIRDATGSPAQFMGYIIDVTERHAAETHHRITTERIEAITNLMSDWAWEVDHNGVYTYCSDRVELFLGYRADEVIGKTPFDLMTKEEAARVARIFEDIVKNKTPIRNLENWNMSKAGTPVCLLTNGIPLFSTSGELLGYRGVDTDITEQKNNEEILRRAHSAALEALRVKNEFMGNMSHELRTPLNGIYGALQLLDNLNLSAEQTEYVTVASDSCRQLIELVNNLLNYSSIQSGKIRVRKQLTLTNELLRSHARSTKLLIQKLPVDFHLNISDDVPAEITTDPIWLTQVISNLTNNAIKFTPAGDVRLNVKRNDVNNELCFEVIDTGIGIEKEKCDRIFEPFYQIESGKTRKYEGAGLGLAISKDIVGHLGGSMGLESQPGQGTRIWFTLPVETLQ